MAMKRKTLAAGALALFFGFAGPNLSTAFVNPPQTTVKTSQRDLEFEKRVEAKLRLISEKAVATFREATANCDAAQYREAKAGFAAVLKLAPDFPDALRRLGFTMAALGDSIEAERLMRRALEIDRSAANLAALAYFLISAREAQKLSEAGTLVKEARRLEPLDPYVLTTAIIYGFTSSDENTWRQALYTLKQTAPEAIETHYWSAYAAAHDGNRELAENEIRRAKELGLPLDNTTRFLQMLNEEQTSPWSWLRKVGVVALIWIAGLIILLLAGFILSKITLATIEATQHNATIAVGSRERRLRRIYRSIIAITSVYYYISIPIVIVLVLIIGGAVLYSFLALGHIPVKLFLIVAIGVLYSVYAMVRSLFIKPPESEPGKALLESEAPLLWAAVREVAQRVGTRPVDTIYLTPGTEVAVMERGSLLEKIRGAAKRCLILGIGVMEGLTRRQLCAVLAHEYGHFAHKDTAGGNMAWQVNHTIQQAAWGLALNGLAKWYNPAWLFITGFNRIFLRVTLGASRLQEILADRYAAISYGAKAFAEGLTHVIKRGIEFNFTATAELKKALAEKRQPANLYALAAPSQGDDQQTIENQFKQAMSHPMSEYDSHPPANQRIEWVHRLKADDAKPEADGAAWDLLPQRTALEETETRTLYESVIAQR